MAARLAHLEVTGLRCLHGFNVSFEPLTALIGANGAGKSSTVRALEFLFGQTDLDNSDCTEGLDGDPIVVTATFTGLPEVWANRLSPWLNDEGDLVISRRRVVASDGAAQTLWLTTRRSTTVLTAIRSALNDGSSANDLKAAYEQVRSTAAPTLPRYTNRNAVAPALDQFEEDNPGLPQTLAADTSVGFAAGLDHNLNGLVELLVLPAFRDAASDSTDATRTSNLTRLINATARADLNMDEDLQTLAEATATEYQRIIATRKEDLTKLADQISAQLHDFAPGARVTLDWDPRLPVLSPPPIHARIVESGHEADIGRQGHGVQRAYVFSLLRALLAARRGAASDLQPSLLLLIEEPEVYQHPVRARYVARTLRELSRSDESTQVVYTTHSPYFVFVDQLTSVRLLRMHPADDSTLNRSRAFAFDVQAVAAQLNTAFNGHGRPWTAGRIASQLPALLDSTVAEGLFADSVCLVEGHEDVGFLEGAAAARGQDLTEHGCALVGVSGKANLPLARAVFDAFGIPAFVVFDTDIHNESTGNADAPARHLDNHALTSLCGGPAAGDPGTHISDRWASSSPTLAAVVQSEIGPSPWWDQFKNSAEDLGLRTDKDRKNGYLIRTVTTSAYASGHVSAHLDGILDALLRTTVH